MTGWDRFRTHRRRSRGRCSGLAGTGERLRHAHRLANAPGVRAGSLARSRANGSLCEDRFVTRAIGARALRQPQIGSSAPAQPPDTSASKAIGKLRNWGQKLGSDSNYSPKRHASIPTHPVRSYKVGGWGGRAQVRFAHATEQACQPPTSSGDLSAAGPRRASLNRRTATPAAGRANSAGTWLPNLEAAKPEMTKKTKPTRP